jgi:hypothetical protein
MHELGLFHLQIVLLAMKRVDVYLVEKERVCQLGLT